MSLINRSHTIPCPRLCFWETQSETPMCLHGKFKHFQKGIFTASQVLPCVKFSTSPPPSPPPHQVKGFLMGLPCIPLHSAPTPAYCRQPLGEPYLSPPMNEQFPDLQRPQVFTPLIPTALRLALNTWKKLGKHWQP